MVSKTFSLFSVCRNAAWIDQIESSRWSDGVQEFLRAGSGGVDPLLAGTETIVPSCEFVTSAIASGLAMTGLNGLVLSGSDVLNLWFQLRGLAGPASGATHSRVTLSNGVLYPTGLRASVSGAAMLSMAAVGISADGTTSPTTVAHTETLTHTLSTGQEFRAGPWTIDGVALDGVVEMDMAIGLDWSIQAGDGQVYPTSITLRARQLGFVIRSLDVSFASSARAVNKAISGTTKGYLRKRASGSGNVADGTAEHISFTIAKGNYRTATVDGTDGGPSYVETVITPIYDGSNDVVAISTATAIT